MFLTFKWYEWLAVAAVIIIAIPLKIRFLKWRNRRAQKKKQQRKWGDDA